MADRAPYQLSMGERRRVAIATVLAMRPSLLVLDEPSANLDPRARRELIDILAQIERTMLLTTHDLPLAAELCERAVILAGGAIVADAPCHEILADATLLAAHDLELPGGFDLDLVVPRPRPGQPTTMSVPGVVAESGCLRDVQGPVELRVAREEVRLGDRRLLELVEQHALVGSVDVGEAVRRAHHEQLGVRRGRREGAHDRDRAAAARHHDLGAPGGGPHLARRGVGRSGGPGGEAVAGGLGAHLEPDAERLDGAQVLDDGALPLDGVLLGVEAQIHARAGARRESR